jgi:acetyl esterase/lipase
LAGIVVTSLAGGALEAHAQALKLDAQQPVVAEAVKGLGAETQRLEQAELEVRDLVYAKRGDVDLDLMYITRKDVKEPRPAMLFVHGGAWRQGNKEQFRSQATYLAQKYGIFGVCIKYRLNAVAKYPAALIDCKTAVRWIRSVAAEHRIDTNRIGICGGSAGAHLAALTALTPEVRKFDVEGPYLEYPCQVHLAVLFNGHYDMTGQLILHVQDGDMSGFFGAKPWERPDIYGEASPILWVNSKSPPMLLLHGDKDIYPHQQSVQMAERLQYFKVPAEVEIYPGKPHAWFNHGADLEITTKRMAEFVVKHFQCELLDAPRRLEGGSR